MKLYEVAQQISMRKTAHIMSVSSVTQSDITGKIGYTYTHMKTILALASMVGKNIKYQDGLFYVK